MEDSARELVSPFLVTYRGGDADRSILEAESLGESIAGASKIYTAVAHYIIFGRVPRGRYTREFRSFARPAKPGSWDQLWLVAPATAGSYSIYAPLVNKAVTVAFGQVLNALIELLKKPKESERVADEVHRAILSQNDTLIGGLLDARKDQAELHRLLIETLPELAGTQRKNARRFVTPVGETCSRIVQFTGDPGEFEITEADAEVIREDEEWEVDDMREYRVTRISEINLRTGHCILDIEGGQDAVAGKIQDPLLSSPNNPYTVALNAHTGCTVQAKAVRRGGKIRTLHISDVKILT